MNFREPRMPSIEKIKEIADQNLINNQMKYDISSYFVSPLESQGYALTESDVYKKDGSKFDPERDSYEDSGLSFRTEFTQITETKILTDTRNIEDIDIIDDTSRRPLRDVINNRIRTEERWNYDVDMSTFQHPISDTEVAIIYRYPKYFEKPENRKKEFDVYVTVVTRDERTFVDTSTIRQATQAIGDILEDEIKHSYDGYDFNVQQKNYKEALAAFKEDGKE